MNALILTTAQRQELEVLNASGDSRRQLEAVQAGDGLFVLNSDLLQDCGLDGTWAHYADLLAALPTGEVTPPGADIA